MDWNAAIEVNRQALKGVLAALVAMAGLAGERPVMSRHLRCAVLRLLRPAEAAARRLVIVLAQTMPVESRWQDDDAPRRPARSGTRPSTLSLPMFDSLNPLRSRVAVRCRVFPRRAGAMRRALRGGLFRCPAIPSRQSGSACVWTRWRPHSTICPRMRGA